MARQISKAARVVTARHKDRILNIPGVTGIFTGEKTTRGKKTGQQAVVVTVEQKKPLSRIPEEHRIPSEIDGIPTDVIREVFRPCADEDRYDPIVGGTSISVTPDYDSSFSSGTMGMIVHDVATGDPMLLSCWHVMYGAGLGSAGDVVVNPPYSGGSPTADQIGTLTRYALSANVDGAVAFVSGRDSSPAILDLGTPAAIADAAVDMVVFKRGKTSGLTTGTVTATDWSGMIDYGPPIGVQSFSGMIRFEGSAGMVLGGDSGAVLITGETIDGGGGGGCFVPLSANWNLTPYSILHDVGEVNFADGSETPETILIDPATLADDEQFSFSARVDFSGPGDGVTDQPLASFIVTESGTPNGFAGVQVEWSSVTNDGWIYLYGLGSGFDQQNITDADLYGGFDINILWLPATNTVSYSLNNGVTTYNASVDLDTIPGDLDFRMNWTSATALAMDVTDIDICVGATEMLVGNWVSDSVTGSQSFGDGYVHTSGFGSAHNTANWRSTGEDWTLTATVVINSGHSTEIKMGVDGLANEYYALMYSTDAGGGLEVGSLNDTNSDSSDLTGQTVVVTLDYNFGSQLLTATFDGSGAPIIISTTTDDGSFPPALPLYPSIRVYEETPGGGASVDDMVLI